MRKRLFVAAGVIAMLIATTITKGVFGAAEPVPFKEARLITEINATDGDAGLQVFLDHEPWRSISISRPDGSKILDVQTSGVLQDYGLTELFSESSEPPFEQFPLDEFKQLFPEGNYTFTGSTIDGVQMESTVPFSHDFPSGPRIRAPQDDARIGQDDVVVRWTPGPQPPGVKLKSFQVLVVKESGAKRVFSADLGPGARSIEIPEEFMQAGVEEYKAEVLAIDVTGNQTLSEVAFSTR
jgi:hypothetical protein